MNIRRYKLEYSDDDIKFVKQEIEKTLKSGYLTDGGPNVKQFEQMWSAFNGSKYSIAVSSCTTGLETILRALDVKGYSVIVPAYTFIASAMSVYNSGGTPVYADIDKSTLGLSLNSIKSSIRDDTKAVIVVHVGGVITNEIQKIRQYCDERGLFLIEDAACAHGASYQGVKSGNFGHAGCFSFHHSKVLTSGEGGIITTDSEELYARMKRIRAIGLDRTINNWESFEIGSNAKMSEITAILAILHTKNANNIIAERRKIAKIYDQFINFNKKIIKFNLPDKTESSFYKYFVKVDSLKTKESFKKYAASCGIELPPEAYSYTCDKQLVSKKMGCILNSDLSNSNFMIDHHFCLPMYNGLEDKEIKHIINVLNNFIEKNR